jgi:hypothetical protein
MKNDGLEAPSAKTGWKPILRQFFGALGDQISTSS